MPLMAGLLTAMRIRSRRRGRTRVVERRRHRDVRTLPGSFEAPQALDRIRCRERAVKNTDVATTRKRCLHRNTCPRSPSFIDRANVDEGLRRWHGRVDGDNVDALSNRGVDGRDFRRRVDDREEVPVTPVAMRFWRSEICVVAELTTGPSKFASMFNSLAAPTFRPFRPASRSREC